MKKRKIKPLYVCLSNKHRRNVLNLWCETRGTTVFFFQVLLVFFSFWFAGLVGNGAEWKNNIHERFPKIYESRQKNCPSVLFILHILTMVKITVCMNACAWKSVISGDYAVQYTVLLWKDDSKISRIVCTQFSSILKPVAVGYGWHQSCFLVFFTLQHPVLAVTVYL